MAGVVKYLYELVASGPRACYRYWQSLYESGFLPIVSPVVPRQEWGAEPAKAEIKQQANPVNHFVMSWTNTAPCHTRDECVKVVRELQREHMANGRDDIEYNFIVGGDGRIYEGRGWYAETCFPESNKRAQRLVGKCINVGLVSQPTDDAPAVMTKTVSSLMAIADDDKHVKSMETIVRVGLDNFEEIIFAN